MRVLVLGLDGATWDILGPLADRGELPNLDRLRKQGASGLLHSVFPPLSPVAWTGVMTGKNSGKHGVYEFLDFGHDPMHARVNSSRSIRSDLVWEIAARYGKKAVAGGVPMSYPGRPCPGLTFLGDFLSPPDAPDFCNDPALMADLERELGEPYRPWNTSVHEGGNEARALSELTAFLDQHLKTVRFLVKRCDWDLFMFDLMATDRMQHELWHVWDTTHRVAKGRERELEALKPAFIAFWKRLDEGIGQIEADLPPDTTLLLMSDHGFGPVEWFVNFNVWLLEKGYLALQDSFYVKQKAWFYRRGVTPETIYNVMTKLGLASHRVSRFSGDQDGGLTKLADSLLLSRQHIDWSRTQAYAQGNFGQINLNVRGRQPSGSVDPGEVRALTDRLIADLNELKHPRTGEPLVDRVVERDEQYHGPHASDGPDLTVVLKDWRYRTIGLHDFTTNKVISPAFGPTGDHRMEGVFIASGPAIRSGASPEGATLLDIAPTVLYLLGIPSPGDQDGRVISEVLDPSFVPESAEAVAVAATGDGPSPTDSSYSDADEAAIQKRLADLGYL